MSTRRSSHPQVSVVMTVYNGAPTLVEAVESILGQTHNNFELIVVDDGSTDATFELLKLYADRDNRVIIIRNRDNMGVANSLNTAIEMASGQYIMRADADDISLTYRMERQLAFLEANHEVGLVSCFVDLLFSPDVDFRTRKDVGADLERTRRALASNPRALTSALRMVNIFHHGEVTFRRSLWEATGGYRPAFITTEDYDLWLRMMPLASFAILPAILYIKRYNSSTLTGGCPLQLIKSMHRLTLECYQLRARGKRDDVYALNVARQVLADYGLTEQFGHQLSGGHDPARAHN